ncbi:RDD family protein [Angustibacter sp. McL0619]|uniref:RDD family protein n=1 Tax=Angustibacter sp. McL0619 TaxID=3415676 RepID=UPI003CEF3226
MTQHPDQEGQRPEPPAQQPFQPPAPPADYGEPPQYGAPPPYGNAPQYAGGYGPPAPGVGPESHLMGKRFLGRILDGLIGLAIGLVIAIPLGLFSATTGSRGMYSGVQLGTTGIMLVIWGAYEIYLVGSRGQTLGMMAAGIKLVSTDTGLKPDYGSAALRWIILAAGYAICFIPFLLICFSPMFDGSGRQQGWHDKASKTQVVLA